MSYVFLCYGRLDFYRKSIEKFYSNINKKIVVEQNKSLSDFECMLRAYMTLILESPK